MHSCSVAVLFQQVQYLVHDVSWPNMPYSQSQCSLAIGPSEEIKHVYGYIIGNVSIFNFIVYAAKIADISYLLYLLILILDT